MGGGIHCKVGGNGVSHRGESIIAIAKKKKSLSALRREWNGREKVTDAQISNRCIGGRGWASNLKGEGHQRPGEGGNPGTHQRFMTTRYQSRLSGKTSKGSESRRVLKL